MTHRPILLDKRCIFPLVLLAASITAGIKLHGALRIQESQKRYGEHNAKVKKMNIRLVAEKEELKDMMSRIQQNGVAVKATADISKLADAAAFKDMAVAVYSSLQERSELLASKEELLWHKEMELEESRKHMSARQEIETEMAHDINTLAILLVESNSSVPRGLASRPYVAASVARRILRTGEDRIPGKTLIQADSPNGDRDTSSPLLFSFMLKGLGSDFYHNSGGLAKFGGAVTLAQRDQELLAAEGLALLGPKDVEEGLALMSAGRPSLPEEDSEEKVLHEEASERKV